MAFLACTRSPTDLRVSLVTGTLGSLRIKRKVNRAKNTDAKFEEIGVKMPASYSWKVRNQKMDMTLDIRWKKLSPPAPSLAISAIASDHSSRRSGLAAPHHHAPNQPC